MHRLSHRAYLPKCGSIKLGRREANWAMREHKAHGPVKWIIPAVLPEGGWEQFPELHEFELWEYPAMKRLEKSLLVDCLQWWYLEIECLSRPGIPQIGLELRQQRIRCHCRNSCSLISTTGDYPKEESLGRRRGRRCIEINGGVARKDRKSKMQQAIASFVICIIAVPLIL